MLLRAFEVALGRVAAEQLLVGARARIDGVVFGLRLRQRRFRGAELGRRLDALDDQALWADHFIAELGRFRRQRIAVMQIARRVMPFETIVVQTAGGAGGRARGDSQQDNQQTRQ